MMRWVLALVLLAACSPTPAAQKAASAKSPVAAAKIAKTPPTAWALISGIASVHAYWPDETHPRLAVTCDGRRHLVRIAFLADPADQAIASETVTITAGAHSLTGPVSFRSAEDVAADDPPAFAEFAPAAVEPLLASGQPIRFARSRHPAIDTAADNGFLRQVVESCRG